MSTRNTVIMSFGRSPTLGSHFREAQHWQSHFLNKLGLWGAGGAGIAKDHRKARTVIALRRACDPSSLPLQRHPWSRRRHRRLATPPHRHCPPRNSSKPSEMNLTLKSWTLTRPWASSPADANSPPAPPLALLPVTRRRRSLGLNTDSTPHQEEGHQRKKVIGPGRRVGGHAITPPPDRSQRRISDCKTGLAGAPST
jgi:hypothetical protein